MSKLDIEDHTSCLEYLLRRGLIRASEQVTIRPLPGGVSNRTVLVSAPKGAFVLKQALSKLRVASDWYSDPLRIHIEARGLRCLETLAPAGAITPLLFEDEQEHVIAMKAVPEPHDNWKTVLMTGAPEPRHVRQFASILASIHRRSSSQAATFAVTFEDRSFFESLRLEPYYRYSAREVPASKAFFEALIAETLARRDAIVHGDFSPKNILIYQDRLVLLDHEVIHFGDPAFDIGFSLTHLLSKAHHFAARRQQFIESAQLYVSQYLRSLGDGPWNTSLQARAVRHTVGCLLARVAGRSPLEYLTVEERTIQTRVVLAMMSRPSDHLSDFISEFSERLHCPK